jgi:type II secretory pathway pseudopilin PulG
VNRSGYTLIELVIVIGIFIVLTSTVLVNFRSNEGKKQAALGADSIISALRIAQNSALTGRLIPASICSQGSAANEYQLSFNYTTTYTLSAFDRCGDSYDLETYTLPQGAKISSDGLQVDISGVTYTEADTLKIRFRPPFGTMTMLRSGSATIQPFAAISIIVGAENSDYTKTVKVDGVSGRIGL